MCVIFCKKNKGEYIMKRTIRKTIAAVMSLIVTIGAFSLNGLKAYADSDNVDISSKYATKLNVGDYDNYLRMNDSFSL